jgi:hypothetical protein
MATKKKAAMKKAAKTRAPRPVLEIFILPDGSVFPDPVFVDPNGVKHPPKVFWQAVNVMKEYEIVLITPPCPFDQNGPFPTDEDGRTPTLTVSKKCSGSYGYKVFVSTARGKLRRLTAGGIIVDA